MNCCRGCLKDFETIEKDTVRCDSCVFEICYDCDYKSNYFTFTPDDKIICKLCVRLEEMKKQIQSR
jgi:hypothetical protein